MPILHVTLQGRTGNQCLQWLFCCALAENYRYELRCAEWVGEKVFDIPAARYTGTKIERFNELDIFDAMERRVDVEFRGYAQMTRRKMGAMEVSLPSMIYTKRQAQGTLRIKPELLAALERLRQHHFPNDTIVAHHRKGDFIGYSYPVVSRLSYRQEAHRYFGFGSRDVQFVSEEEPLPHTGLPDGLEFLPDFYRLMLAPTLMRANSTFSFLAGLLSNGLVLSPRIDGLVGGVEHDGVQFEAGNHCRLANFDFCSDLHVTP